MIDILLIFDETDLWELRQMLWCCVIENISKKEIEGKLSEIFRKSSLTPSFWDIKNCFPHYTEDHPTQRNIILDNYRKLGYIFNFTIQTYEEKHSLEKIYEEELIRLIKPLVIKYIKRHGSDKVNFHFLFEQISDKGIHFFENIILQWLSNGQKISIEILTKNSYQWLSALSDYNCWVIRDFLIDINADKDNSLARNQYKLIENKIWYWNIDNKYFHFNNYHDKSSFFDYNWCFK